MNYSLFVKTLLAIALSVILPVGPKYCLVHKTLHDIIKSSNSKRIKIDMNYSLFVKTLLAIALSVILPVGPKYCLVHKTLDYCFEQSEKEGGGDEILH